MKVIVVAAMGCLALASCSLYSVKDGVEGISRNGIPFLAKQPVRYQMTKVAMTHWKVTFVLKAGGKEFPAPSGGMEVVASDDALTALYRIGGALSNDVGITPDNFTARVEAQIGAADVHWGGCLKAEPSGIVCVRPSVRYGRTIENHVIVVSELSETQRYINTRRPWIGTASATITLAEDGTLASAESEVEDKTVETILSVLPISDFLTKQWGLSGEGAAEIAAKVARNDAEATAKWRTAGRPKPIIELRLEPVAWTYVLRRRLDGNASLGSALTYPESDCEKSGAKSGETPAKSCVQLVSATSSAADKPTEAKKPAGWTISGSLVPPEKE